MRNRHVHVRQEQLLGIPPIQMKIWNFGQSRLYSWAPGRQNRVHGAFRLRSLFLINIQNNIFNDIGFYIISLLNKFACIALIFNEVHDCSVRMVRYACYSRYTRQKLVHSEGNTICSLSVMPGAAFVTARTSPRLVRVNEKGTKTEPCVVQVCAA